MTIIEGIIINGVSEVMKHFIKSFFDEDKNEISIKELQSEVENLTIQINKRFSELETGMKSEFDKVIREVPYVKVDEEKIILKEEFKESKFANQEEMIETIKKVWLKRVKEISEYTEYEEIEKKPKIEKPTNVQTFDKEETSSTSEWEKELQETIYNIKLRRLNIK